MEPTWGLPDDDKTVIPDKVRVALDAIRTNTARMLAPYLKHLPVCQVELRISAEGAPAPACTCGLAHFKREFGL